MGVALVAKRQNQDLDRNLLRRAGVGLRRDDNRPRVAQDGLGQRPDLLPIFLTPQLGKAAAPKFAAEQGVGARAGDAKRQFAVDVIFKHENIGQNWPQRARIDIVALGRAALALQTGASTPVTVCCPLAA